MSYFCTENSATITKEEIADKFAALRSKYDSTFMQVKVIICKHIPLKRLKEQISCQWLYTEVEESIKTSDQLMESFWRQSCGFPYLHELGTLVDALGIGSAQRTVAEYEEMRRKFYRQTSVKEFASLSLGEECYDKNVKVLNVCMAWCGSL